MFTIIQREPPPPSLVDPSISRVWDPIVIEALAKSRDERYPAARELAHAVKDAPAR